MFSSFSSASHFAQQSGTRCALLVKGIIGNIRDSCETIFNYTRGSGGDVV